MHSEPATLHKFCGIAALLLPQKSLHFSGWVIGALTVQENMSITLRVTAIYLIISGIIGTVWPLLNIGPNHPEFEGQSFAYQLGSYARELSISLAFLISGIGLIKLKLWARKVALVALVLAFYYSGNAMAWGYAGGKPSSNVVIYSYLVCSVWYGVWFLILYRRSTIAQLTSQVSGAPPSGAPS